jgi:hypothetical protein|tara:strand:+ start:477 stop:644 length:168 start_codon:yes stop_codon:yes gene_type:complete
MANCTADIDMSPSLEVVIHARQKIIHLSGGVQITAPEKESECQARRSCKKLPCWP